FRKSSLAWYSWIFMGAGSLLGAFPTSHSGRSVSRYGADEPALDQPRDEPHSLIALHHDRRALDARAGPHPARDLARQRLELASGEPGPFRDRDRLSAAAGALDADRNATLGRWRRRLRLRCGRRTRTHDLDLPTQGRERVVLQSAVRGIGLLPLHRLRSSRRGQRHVKARTEYSLG